MKIRLLTFIFSAVLAVGTYSCSNDHDDTIDPTNGDKVVAAISANIADKSMLRAHDGQWDENDAIGLTMLTHEGRDIVDNVFNYHYYTPSASGNFRPQDQNRTIYFPQDGSPVTFRAYYPFYANLSTDMRIPISVANQNVLPNIDFMSADHINGFSKSDPNVHLTFHHRLSKLIFRLNIQEGQPAFPLEDLSLTIRGMKTTGVYDLLNEVLMTDDQSISDIAVPYMGIAAGREAIVMPRDAEAGISFQFRAADGSEYIANMSDTLNLRQGYKYIFNVNLRETGLTISADIVPWVEGPTSNYDALEISTPAGTSEGVIEGDQMTVYLGGDNGFSVLNLFTYSADGRWYPETPVYWQNIEPDPAPMRASMVRNPAINETQLPEILTAEEINVPRNTGANFTLKRAVTKTVVQLRSNTFSAEQLANATVVLPNYYMGGELVDGLFVPGQTQGDILVDRRDPENGIAVFQPQVISPQGVVAKITIDGREYTAHAGDYGMPFNAGEASLLIIDINEDIVSISAKIIEWIDLPAIYFSVFQVGTPAEGSVGVEPGDQMNVYLQGDDGFNLLRNFVYDDMGRWVTDPVLYWEQVAPDPAVLRASMIAEPALNATQIPDILIAGQISIPRYDGANFVLNHAGSKVVVRLISPIFSTDQLGNATITLPGFQTGGREQLGQFVPGTTLADILVDRTNPENSTAIIQPQTIAEGAPLVRVNVNGRDYAVNAPAGGFNFNAGEANLLIVNINDGTVGLSAKVIDWVDNPASYLNVFEMTTPPEANEGINPGDRMNVYIQDNGDFSLLRNFTYTNLGSWITDPDLYWEQITADPAVLRASMVAAPALNTSQLPDILIADQISVPQYGSANFVLNHAASKVIVRLISSTFNTNQLLGSTITLPGYLTGGTEQLGQFVPGTTRADIQVDRTDPENSTAIFQPQAIAAGSPIVRINLNGKNYIANAPAGGFSFNAGEATLLIVTLNEEGVSVSARVVDWVDNGPVDLTALTVGVPASGAEGVLDGEQMNVYTDNGTGRPLLATYTYNAGINQFTTPTPVYWESLNDPTTFYASILRQSQYNPTQLDDYLIAEPVQVSASNGISFNLTHPASKVVVQLTSSDGSFSDAELAQMSMVLPNYAIGGTFANGVFTLGTGVGNITVETGVGTGGNSAIAIIQPQTIPANTNVITITSPTGRVYNAAMAVPLTFGAGISTILNIDITKTLASMSANVVDWMQGNIINMVPQSIRVTGTLDDSGDFFRNKTISVYKFGADFQSLTYSYLPQTTGYEWRGAPIYWDDQQAQPLSVTAVYYPYENFIPTIGAGTTSFAWNLPAVQSQGYENYDLLTSHLTLTSPQYVNFVFNHPLSKVRVELSSMEFTPAELAGATVRLNGFLINGNIIMNSGAASATGSRTSIVPNTDADGSRYSALVMPQTITSGSQVVTITLKEYPNTPFTGTISNTINFIAGLETVIKVDLKKTEIQLSAKVQDWQEGDTGNIIIQ